MVSLWMIYVESNLCGTQSKGPYILPIYKNEINAPTRSTIQVERAQVVKDVELTLMYRSFWTSYCYNGGALDGNTGCINNLRQKLPDYEESAKWIEKQACSVGPDCKACWGSDSQVCLKPEELPQTWTKGKELEKLSNNNHFAFHSCNLSWRCGIHKTTFPTLLTIKNGAWIAYTEYSNGSEIIMDSKDYWKMRDAVLRKTGEHKIKIDNIIMPCFSVEEKELSCFDGELGNFIEFKSSVVCQKKVCYKKIGVPADSATHYANLKAASIEDLQQHIQVEHMLNEELRYNFGMVLAEIAELRKILTKVIISTSKIDDHLIGTILENNAKSNFVSKEVFFLTPCATIEQTTSNCYKDMRFKNGRWIPNTTNEVCTNVTSPEEIKLFDQPELWFPEIHDHEATGTAENFEGWTYYAREQENLNKAMEWTKNGQATTSLSDIANLPIGFVNHALIGLATSHIAIIACAAVFTVVLIRQKRNKNHRDRDNNLQVAVIAVPGEVEMKERVETKTMRDSINPIHFGIQPTTNGNEERNRMQHSNWDRF